ncbi:MAG: chemotaxis protein CheW [Wenzhouxiangellaceae bacterium]|nr:chemotaxis protein CheW [Wenzhouxiangellaceae bacterium]
MTTTHQVDLDSRGITGTGSQYLTFMLADEEYGVDILSVREIRGWQKPTPIPRAPGFLKGVINIRGSIVPIIDLRERFEMDAIDYGDSTVVIVLHIPDEHSEKGHQNIGIVVDAVSEVYSVGPDSIKPTPDFGGAAENQFVHGLATLEEKMIILLDIDRLISKTMLAGLQIPSTH